MLFLKDSQGTAWARDISMDEITRIFGGKIGKSNIKYVHFSREEYINGLMKAGLSKNMAEQLGEEKIQLKTQVEFRSDKFPPYDGEEEEINPGLWGKRLAEYLQENLPHHGVKVTGIGSEDWGWMVELENDELPLWIGRGHQDGDNNEFLCFIYRKKLIAFIRASQALRLQDSPQTCKQ